MEFKYRELKAIEEGLKLRIKFLHDQSKGEDAEGRADLSVLMREAETARQKVVDEITRRILAGEYK